MLIGAVARHWQEWTLSSITGEVIPTSRRLAPPMSELHSRAYFGRNTFDYAIVIVDSSFIHLIAIGMKFSHSKMECKQCQRVNVHIV